MLHFTTSQFSLIKLDVERVPLCQTMFSAHACITLCVHMCDSMCVCQCEFGELLCLCDVQKVLMGQLLGRPHHSCQDDIVDAIRTRLDGSDAQTSSLIR